jgi:hypothetical protein
MLHADSLENGHSMVKCQTTPRWIGEPSSTHALCRLQVSIVDGQIVVDRATLTVQAQAEDMQRTIVEDTQQLNSRSYAVNRTPSERWQPEETENFFRVGACRCSRCFLRDATSHHLLNKVLKRQTSPTFSYNTMSFSAHHRHLQHLAQTSP